MISQKNCAVPKKISLLPKELRCSQKNCAIPEKILLFPKELRDSRKDSAVPEKIPLFPKRFRPNLIVIGIAIANLLLVSPVQAARIACPTEVEPLVKSMLRDLPGYANRIAVRSRIGSPRNSVIVAGRPEFEPLPLNSDRPIDPALKQVFLTTLEREIVGKQAITLQQFHWLFLARTSQGWQLALMFTRIGTTEPQPIIPPTASREGIIGQAVQLWLRDCNAQGIRSSG